MKTTKPKRVIFLDFDGVILTFRMRLAHRRGWTGSGPDPVACYLLRRVCETGVRLVLSTSHRDNVASCMETLTKGNLHDCLHKDWKTKELSFIESGITRPFEINAWTKKHPEVKDYRILDDEKWNWTPDQCGRVIKCHEFNGLDALGMKELSDWVGLKPFYKLKPKGKP